MVSICGGEPLIYPHISELVDILTHMRKYVYLCTNGVLLAEAVGKLKPSRHLLLNVHIDGPPEVHDVVVSKNGAYESAIKGIMLAARTGFQVTVNTTVCKQTDMNQIDALMDKLSQIGVQCFMLSPAYSYEAVESRDCFMSRADIHEKFRDIDRIAQRHRLADSPIYLEYLKGERELKCTAWGNPTRNPVGWRSPCYLIADHHFASYKELIDRTNWESYGIGRTPAARTAWSTAASSPRRLMVNKQQGDLWKMFRWQFW